MDQPQATTDRPRRVAWFAPWRWFPQWKPWQRWTLAVGLVLVAYLMSVIPVMWVTVRLGGIEKWSAMLDSVYLPVTLLEKVTPIHKFYEVQQVWLWSVLGDPVNYRSFKPPR